MSDIHLQGLVEPQVTAYLLSHLRTEAAYESWLQPLVQQVYERTEGHPSLGRYLAQTIKTGTLCSYTPPDFSSIDWQF